VHVYALFSSVFAFLLSEEEWQLRLEEKRSMNKKGSQVSTPVRAEQSKAKQSKAKQSRTMLKFELLMFESRN
jgi:hypothetical protein